MASMKFYSSQPKENDMDSLKKIEDKLRDIAMVVSQGFTEGVDEDLVRVADRIEALMGQSSTVTVISVGGRDTIISTKDADSAKTQGYEPRTYYTTPQDCEEVREALQSVTDELGRWMAGLAATPSPK